MRSRKFWFFFAAVLAVWWVISRQTVVGAADMDTITASGIALAVLSAAVGMAVVRTDWTARALGVFGIFLGSGLLYLAIADVVDRWDLPLTETQLNGLRSLLLVSAVLFNVGFWRWVAGYRTQNGGAS
jgi:hypothetical protein